MLIVNVAAEVVVLVTLILVTTVIVLVLGCVYNVVLVVAAAVLASTFDVTAISYCTFLLLVNISIRVFRFHRHLGFLASADSVDSLSWLGR